MTQPTAQESLNVLDTARAGGLVMRGSIFRVLGYGTGSGLALVSAVLLTRHLGVTRFGQYTTIVAVATLTTQLTEAGLTSYSTREFAVTGAEQRDSMMRDLLGMQVAAAVVAVILGMLFAVAAGYGEDRVVGMLLACVGMALATLQGTLAVPLLARLRLGLVSSLELLRQALLVALTATLVLVGAGLVPLLGAITVSSAVVIAVTLAATGRELPMHPSLQFRRWVTHIGGTVTFSLAYGVSYLYAMTTQVVTSLTASGHQTGLFSASNRTVGVLAATSGLVVSSALPLLSRVASNDRDRLRFATQKLFEVSTLIGVAATVGAVTGAVPIIAIVGGLAKYHGAVPVVRIQGASLVFTFVAATWSYTLLALRRHAVLLASNCLALVLTAVATLLLASRIGAEGAAVANVVGEFTVCVCFIGALVRGSELRPRLSLPLRALAASIPAFAVMLLRLPPGVQLAAALAIYVVAVLALRAVPPELRELLPKRFHAVGDGPSADI